ncbi:MAG: M20 family metallopeptidase [Spirochaetaceae bacterium]|jgi:glutamate carboxypeptidase|nr:M20 family metallopeptidase [Spirochaetaceae bacterium]
MTSFALPEYVEALEHLVNIDSGSKNKKGADTIADFFEERYKKLGLSVKRFYPSEYAGSCLEIRNKPDSDGIDLLMSGHMDTVFPDGTAARRRFKVENGRAYGPGVLDMKAGLLSAYYLAAALTESGSNISFCVAHNSDEEISSIYSRDWISGLARHSRYGFILEPGRKNGEFVHQRKGLAKFRLEFRGIASHAGVAPERGASAVHEMSRWITELVALNNYSAGTSLNAGTAAGGTVANTVAAYACCEIDTRFAVPEELEKIKAAVQKLSENRFDQRVEVASSISGYRPPMNPSKHTFELMRLVEEVGGSLGMTVKWVSTGGGSDGNLIAAEGCAVIDALGPCGDKSHSDDEYMILDTVEPRLELAFQAVKALEARL